MSASRELARHLARMGEVGADLSAELALCVRALRAAGCDLRLNDYWRIDQVVVPLPYQPFVRSQLGVPWLDPESGELLHERETGLEELS